LSDTLGVSMLVDAVNHHLSEKTTETTVLGPFYVQNPLSCRTVRTCHADSWANPFMWKAQYGRRMAKCWTAPLSISGTRTRTGSMTCNVATLRCRRSGRGSAQMRKANSTSGRSCRSSIPSQTTGQWERCSRRQDDIPIAQHTCTS
jgi:hypothetical protein